MSNFDESVVRAAIERIKQYLGMSTDKELARYLGLSDNTLNMWKRRGTLDISLIYNKVLNVSLDWVLTGKGDSTSIEYNSTDPIKRIQENTAKYISKSLNPPTIGKSSRPQEAERHGIDVDESSTIPVYYGVSAGNPSEAFNELKGYFKYAYLVNERTIGIDMNTEEYGAYGFDVGDVVIVDTVRMPEDGNIVLVKLEEVLDLLQYFDDKQKVLFKKIAPEQKIKNYRYEDGVEVVGVAIAKIRKL